MEKCRCGKKPVFFRKYEGRFLCKNHFLDSVEKKVKKTIGSARMIKSGDKIAIAVSGGKDSSLVLYLMNKILKPRKDIEIFAISVDEGVAGYRPESLKLAKKLCKSMGVEHHVFSFKGVFGKTLDQKVNELKKGNPLLTEPCTYCGVGRRYILNHAARDLKATKLCTGHNLDDEVQAILMNYVRGDLFRAARMGPVTNWSIKKKKGVFIPRIKPLREVPERESALYVLLKDLGICWDECPYASGLRFDVREFINLMESKYSGVKFSILQTFDKMLPGIRQLTKREEGEILVCKKCGEPASKEICKTCELWTI
jgi:uncharacterized protein (TIGR00269 family)